MFLQVWHARMVHNPSLRFEEGGASFDRNPVQKGTESSFIETPNHVRASMSPPLCSTAIAAETEWKAVSLQHEWIGCPVDSADATLYCCRGELFGSNSRCGCWVSFWSICKGKSLFPMGMPYTLY